MLDVVLDPKFTTNHRIFFSFYDFGFYDSSAGTNSNTYIARATLDEAKVALSDAKVIFQSPARNSFHKARRQDRRPHRHRSRRHSLHAGRRSLRLAALDGRTATR